MSDNNVFDQARELIERKGFWIAGNDKFRGHFCAVLALDQALVAQQASMESRENYLEEMCAAIKVVDPSFTTDGGTNGGYNSLMLWNDAQEGPEPVLAAFREASRMHEAAKA